MTNKNEELKNERLRQFAAQNNALALLELAKTVGKYPHGFLQMRFNLRYQIKSVKGWVEKEGKRISVIWDAVGAAYVSKERVKEFDLVIDKAYETVC